PTGPLVIPLQNSKLNQESFSISEYGSATAFQQHLHIYDPIISQLTSFRLNITTKEESFGVQKRNNFFKTSNEEALKNTITPLDYIFHVFDKFSTESLLDNRTFPVYLTVVGDSHKLDFASLKNKIQKKVKDIIRALEKTE